MKHLLHPIQRTCLMLTTNVPVGSLCMHRFIFEITIVCITVTPNKLSNSLQNQHDDETLVAVKRMIERANE